MLERFRQDNIELLTTCVGVSFLRCFYPNFFSLYSRYGVFLYYT